MGKYIIHEFSETLSLCPGCEHSEEVSSEETFYNGGWICAKNVRQPCERCYTAKRNEEFEEHNSDE